MILQMAPENHHYHSIMLIVSWDILTSCIYVCYYVTHILFFTSTAIVATTLNHF